MTIKLRNPFNLPLLLAALGCIGLTWFWPRLFPGLAALRWAIALVSILLFVLSFLSSRLAGWLVRKPVILAGYAGATLIRVWPLALGIVALLGVALWFGTQSGSNTDDEPDFVTSSTGGAEITIPSAGSLEISSALTFGKEGTAPGEFREPHGIAIGKDGTIYVADTLNLRVQVFDPSGKPIRQITRGAEAFKQPFALAITNNGELLVLDSERATIERFSSDGKLLSSFGGNLGFYFPRAIALDAQENIYVADTGGSKVVKLSPTGEAMLVFGVKGKERGEFTEPTGVAISPNGTVFTIDPSNRKLSAFSPDATFIRDTPIEAAGSVNAPKLVLEPGGTLLVSVPEPHLVRRYSASLKPLGEFGGGGTEPGRFRLPTFLARAANDIWVADTLNHRIQKITPK